MSAQRKPGSRKSKQKLEPIDWRELASDAVLNGNMSTLYHRPQAEDASAYASEEALDEIQRRTGRSFPAPEPAESSEPSESPVPAVGIETPVGTGQHMKSSLPAPSASIVPSLGYIPSVGSRRITIAPSRKIKAINDVYDALTLAGQILYKAMYGVPDTSPSKNCCKGYRQLAAETNLDKDTVRDLIADFKQKGIVKEIESYDPDIRLAKTYAVLSGRSAVQLWRNAGIQYVIPGRKPVFCDGSGQPVPFTHPVGYVPTVGPRR